VKNSDLTKINPPSKKLVKLAQNDWVEFIKDTFASLPKQWWIGKIIRFQRHKRLSSDDR